MKVCLQANTKTPRTSLYELIQNADDVKASKIQFSISNTCIKVSHDGNDFNREDVNSITLSGSSTKKDSESTTGQFGIGFKSVFNITKCPKIHSGEYHFEIKNLIVPYSIKQNEHEGTLFILPLDKGILNKGLTADEIIERVEEFAQECLLFLQNIKEISVSFGDEGEVFKKEILPDSKISLSSKEGKSIYLFFSKDKVKIAYKVKGKNIVQAESEKIFVSLPTEEKTNLGFLIHAPYQPKNNRGKLILKKEIIQILQKL